MIESRDAALDHCEPKNVLTLEFASLLVNSLGEIDRLCHFLSLLPAGSQRTDAFQFVTPELVTVE